MSEKLCLQWNDFKENAISAFRSLREEKEFADVTLACEDGKQIEVHKVILASSSPFFQNILSKNKHSHPLVYMRGVKSDDLMAIVDFLYCGEANVFQENLDSFLEIAEELQLEGLMGKPEEEKIATKNERFALPALKKVKPEGHKGEANFLDSGREPNFSEEITTNGTVAVTSYVSGDMKELDEKCATLMDKISTKNAHGQPLYRCKVCGKEAINGVMKGHIEATHLEGVSIPCNFCEKTFRSRNSLKNHIFVHHKEQRYLE